MQSSSYRRVLQDVKTTITDKKGKDKPQNKRKLLWS